ncbi:MAG: class I SAM-dependent rRNA methyltransferase [Roseobacter sp.]
MTLPIADTASTDSEMPIVRMKPKTNARAIRHGFPWVYANEMVADRRTKSRAPGSLAILQDDARRPLGVVALNPLSKIFCRVLDQDAETHIDQNWFEARLSKALAARERAFSEPFYRLVHAEADGLPGVVIDRFDDLCVIQPNAAWAEQLLPTLTQALVAVTGVKHVLKNASGRTRVLEGLDSENAVLQGQAPDKPVIVSMNGASYMADVTGGQKTGLFYDQRPNHAFAASLARGARVLDVFSHVGGFSLAALAHGAQSALAVDASKPALDLAQLGAEATGVADRFETRQGDAFDVLGTLADEGAEFDIVICDPPAFAPSKSSLDAGLRAYERVARLATALVAPNGVLGLCSCSHAADLAGFRAASARGVGRAGRRPSLIYTGFAGPDHPQLPQLAESGYLKSVFFQL